MGANRANGVNRGSMNRTNRTEIITQGPCGKGDKVMLYSLLSCLYVDRAYSGVLVFLLGLIYHNASSNLPEP